MRTNLLEPIPKNKLDDSHGHPQGWGKSRRSGPPLPPEKKVVCYTP